MAIKLEYKGYTTICEPNPEHEGRLCGVLFPPENPFVPLKYWGFAADNLEEAKRNFHIQVEKAIVYKAFQDEQES